MIKKIINEYIKWLEKNFEYDLIEGNTYKLSTPFLDVHNDHIDIYIKKINEDKIIISDDGYFLRDLKMLGVDINTPKRKTILENILNSFGVKKNQFDELFIETNLYELPYKKHFFIQALLSITDLYLLSKPVVFSLFKEEVEKYFRTNNIYFSKDIEIKGKSGYSHYIDFLINPSKNKPERLIKTINKLQKDNISLTIFMYNDIIREENKKYIIYNDIDSPINEEALNALNIYEIDPIPWSDKAKIISTFSN